MNFNKVHWEKIYGTYQKWWEGSLQRPLIKAVIRDNVAYTGSVPLLSQANCNDLCVSPEEIIGRMDAELAHMEFIGDAFPYFGMDCFGPGVLAAFLGAKLDNSTGQVWFHRCEGIPLKDFHLEYVADNVWLSRIKDIFWAGQKRWRGTVLLGMPDLGGVLDILASLYGTEPLLMALLDEPKEVTRLCGEIQVIWHKIYALLAEVNQCGLYGYTDWNGLFCRDSSYILQCDFSYMIGPEMFEEFVLETLRADCLKIKNPTYHLDGPGELKHLDQLLKIPELRMIQWVPGEGSPPPREWLDIYKRIHSSGKAVQVIGGKEDFEAVTRHIGGKGVYLNLCTRPIEDKAWIEAMLHEYQVV